MHNIIRIIPTLVPILLTGCTNVFVANYAGETHPPTRNARVVASAPEGATLIGTSSFVTSEEVTNSEAVYAAKQVGANAVKWSKDFQSQTTEYTTEPIYTRNNAEGETVQRISVPVPTTVNWYRVKARFWRMVDEEPPTTRQSEVNQ